VQGIFIACHDKAYMLLGVQTKSQLQAVNIMGGGHFVIA